MPSGCIFAAWGRITFVSKGVHDKGKPAARRGRKARGPPKEVAGLPKPQEGEQGWDQ